MAGKFELKTSANGKFHFNLKAGNGQIILSSEMYETKAAAENGIASVQKNAVDDARYEKRNAANGEPFFVLKAGNGEQIGRSETYSSDGALDNGIESVKTNAPGAPTEEV
ncbi:MAG: hypothetical protein DMF62_13025 [Acidobacteria bacterium]|nr:MAG: hypothetical protein DMF62_13025 [Acidobacteriota bacterium]